MYGRRTLEKFYMDYSPAALADCDVHDGDANVICFGPKEIDWRSKQENPVEITLDLDRVLMDKPCAFYKQRDFGYKLEKERKINIGDLELSFSHTEHDEAAHVVFELFSKRQVVASASLNKQELIAYNIPQMHQILTLNFFRFLDRLHVGTMYEAAKGLDNDRIKKVYNAIAKLNDKKLVEFLQKLGQLMTDTAEFNFYGAYQVNLSAVLTIKFENYQLDLPKFIKNLQFDNVDVLHAAQAEMPQLFKSYRFVDYLLSQNLHGTIREELGEIRKQCVLPFWMEIQEKNISSTDEVKKHQTAYYEKYRQKKQQEQQRGLILKNEEERFRVNPNTVYENGDTELFRAINNRATDVVELLLNNGADPAKANNKGVTPLHYAASHNLHAIISLMVRRRLTNINVVDNNGITPLIYALNNQAMDAVHVILKEIIRGAFFASRKKDFLKALTCCLDHEKMTPKQIIVLFQALKDQQGMFKAVHEQKNPNWDRVRLFFTANRNKEVEFWHTTTYQKAVKLMKEAYLRKRSEQPAGEILQEEQESEQEFIDYIRGNAPFHLSKTTTRRSL